MLADIVFHSKENYAYILPNDFSKSVVGFRCNSSKKEWTIHIKDWMATMTEEESIILKSDKTRIYFCRSASCKMYDTFNREIKAYINSKRWHDNLSPEENRYVKLVKRYYYLTKKFG